MAIIGLPLRMQLPEFLMQPDTGFITTSRILYPEIFKSLERIRWNMADDIPWHVFDGALLSDEQPLTITMNAITEWAALPATEMFLRDNQHDSDFSAFMSVWFYEEQKHSLVLIDYLRRF